MLQTSSPCLLCPSSCLQQARGGYPEPTDPSTAWQDHAAEDSGSSPRKDAGFDLKTQHQRVPSHAGRVEGFLFLSLYSRTQLQILPHRGGGGSTHTSPVTPGFWRQARRAPCGSWHRHRAITPCEDRASITQLPASAGEPGTAARGLQPPLHCRRPHARPAPRCAGHLLLPAGAGAGALRRGWGRAKPSRRRHAAQLRPPS